MGEVYHVDRFAGGVLAAAEMRIRAEEAKASERISERAERAARLRDFLIAVRRGDIATAGRLADRVVDKKYRAALSFALVEALHG